MATFRPLFGLLTLVVAAQIIWKLYRGRHVRGSCTYAPEPQAQCGVSQTSITTQAVKFSYGGTDFSVPTWSPLIAGVLIAMTASIFGVGRGFLLVPYMASILAMPMHIIPATAAVAIFMSLMVSISNFMALGAPLHLNILIPPTIGAVIGAIVGPWISRAMKNHWLQATMAVIVTGIGLRYTMF